MVVKELELADEGELLPDQKRASAVGLSLVLQQNRDLRPGLDLARVLVRDQDLVHVHVPLDDRIQDLNRDPDPNRVRVQIPDRNLGPNPVPNHDPNPALNPALSADHPVLRVLLGRHVSGQNRNPVHVRGQHLARNLDLVQKHQNLALMIRIKNLCSCNTKTLRNSTNKPLPFFRSLITKPLTFLRVYLDFSNAKFINCRTTLIE